GKIYCSLDILSAFTYICLMKIEIDIDKLVTRVVRSDGEHLVYFNSDVFRHITGLDCKVWGRDLVERGDWVECLDGAVIECLKVNYYYEAKREREVYYCKFCISGNHYYRINRKTGEIYWSRLYGRVTHKVKDWRYRQDEVKLFFDLIMGGMNIREAYKIATKKAYNSMRAYKLLSTKQFKELLMDSSLINQIKERFSDERMIKELMELLDRSRKGSDSHRENIKFILALTGRLPEELYNKKIKSVNEIQRVDYTEIPPPQITE
ncbi:MAG: hypothetical protein N2053_12180, partial [Chitinispirillaceae bacterium]|nr:hypothetical protein [Chitinispirillaceae bacterium]